MWAVEGLGSCVKAAVPLQVCGAVAGEVAVVALVGPELRVTSGVPVTLNVS